MNAAFLLIAALGLSPRACEREATPPSFATFNIENFPKNQRQIEGAFALIEQLQVHFIGVQEIGDPAVFQAEAHRRLGRHWRFVSTNLRPGEVAPEEGEGEIAWKPNHNLGVLYDDHAYRWLSTRIHDETRLGTERHRPTLEVRLQPRAGGSVLRVFVLHLKSGTAGRPVRQAQLQALQGILQKARASGERIVVMGDFNATEQADRTDLAQLARQAGLVWASEGLSCSAFWQRREECPTSSLDHVLSFAKPEAVSVAGACADGCDRQDRCPLYRDEISDHCPVVVRFD